MGLQRRVGYQEAKRILEMDDAARREYLKGNPLVTTALEFMLTASDDSVNGHVGTCFVASEGDHKLVAQRLAEMLSFTRICRQCLERAWCMPPDARSTS